VATAPGGSNTDIQYNNSGAFGGSSNLQWDNTSVRLNIRPALSSSAALSVRGGSDLSSSFSFVAGNNSGTEFFRVRNDGIVSARGNYLQLGTDVNVGIGPTTNGTSFTSSGADVLFAGSNAGSSNACATFNIFGGTKTASSGTLGITGGTFSPTTGSNTYSIINVTSGFVINQTGTATGITRGINIAPTLTAAANYRAIDWNNNTGYGLYGTGTANNYLAGDTVVGTTTPSAKLHSRGSNASSGTNAFLVQNSTPSDIYQHRCRYDRSSNNQQAERYCKLCGGGHYVGGHKFTLHNVLNRIRNGTHGGRNGLYQERGSCCRLLYHRAGRGGYC
jgi:hypothetical protein